MRMMINLLGRRFFFSFFLIFSLWCSAQVTEAQLLKKYEQADALSETDTEKSTNETIKLYQQSLKYHYTTLELKCLLTLGYNYDFINKIEKSLEYAKLLEKRAKEENNTILLTDAYRLQGREFNKLEMRKEALASLDRALTVVDEKDFQARGSIYTEYAIIYQNHDQSKYFESIGNAIKNHQKIKDIKNKNYRLSYDYNILATYYDNKNIYDKAIENYKNSLLFSKENPIMKGVLNYNIGNIYMKKGQWQKALERLLIAEKLAKYKPDLLAYIYDELSNVYLELNENNKSMSYRIKYKELQTEQDSEKYVAAQSVHKQIIEEKDKGFSIQKKLLLAIIFLILLVFTALLIINKNKSKKQFANYQKIIEKLQNQESLLPAPVISNSAAEKTTFSVSSDKEVEILKKLEKFERSEGFKNKNLSLSSMAESLGTNTAYLSTVINSNKNKNFNNYINELRINYIIQKLKNDPQYLKYKISHLAEECGFSSHNTFTIAFSNLAGVSPSNFVKFLTKERQIPEN
ncbi:MAG: helix-turn-helix domain-containing protein [Chryseobacterium sp.]|nr:helix-turn-helix domain-containing protein [Chryseobacterium sp.]